MLRTDSLDPEGKQPQEGSQFQPNGCCIGSLGSFLEKQTHIHEYAKYLNFIGEEGLASILAGRNRNHFRHSMIPLAIGHHAKLFVESTSVSVVVRQPLAA